MALHELVSRQPTEVLLAVVDNPVVLPQHTRLYMLSLYELEQRGAIMPKQEPNNDST